MQGGIDKKGEEKDETTRHARAGRAAADIHGDAGRLRQRPRARPRPPWPTAPKPRSRCWKRRTSTPTCFSYDYFKLAEDRSIGLERTATLIAAARQEFPNTMLLNDSNTIQGTALADYQALVSPVSCQTTLAVYKVMNALKYDAGTIGNHEFNYGLPFLAQVTDNKLDVPNLPPVAQQPSCAGPSFPLVLSNVLGAKSTQPIFKPYTIVTRNLNAIGPDGKTVTVPVKVGVIGFTPPAIMSWDKRNFEGNGTRRV
ncbi:2',3'-cyclic-nucleotide 2'-phosphodiesterase [Candidatus Burkholderia humilis]|nr:2',3'-cyclic-nucleotide 2'-phosphodiesterase [Candidatus Burkholderia humilis]